ncbi:tetratricopeptide repeat protein [Candidatus Parabeggiatoa sp. HSG14]|uniref:tetratricopeptide repeat protein n=1 Tax=Candidatus Parabeggiatoa sp. HSG14 TaxID=3055593 RepID=UPI0025A75358|nr:tetratricopeptide repeat protein [Thiotrichales bacterium HSG14]
MKLKNLFSHKQAKKEKMENVKKIKQDTKQPEQDKNSKITTMASQGWDKAQASSIATFKVFLAGLFVVLFIHTVYELFRYELVIQPFEMPSELSKKGYTGKVVAYRLQDYMAALREEVKRSSQSFAQAVATVQLGDLQKRQEIDVPTVGLSLNSTISQLRTILRLEPARISGDVVIKGNKLHLTLRITDKPNLTVSDTADKLEQLIERAAEYVLKIFEPMMLGLNYCHNNKEDELAALIKHIQRSKPSNQEKLVALTLEGCLLENQENYADALKKLEQVLHYDRKNPVIFIIQGDVLQGSHNPNKNYEKAIKAYKTAANINPNNGGIYTKWAQALLKSGKTKEAFAKYEEASKRDPDNPWVYTDWGDKLADFKEFETADKKFEQAIVKDPSYALAYAMWGDVWLKKRKPSEPEKAIENYKKAVELDSTIAWIYGNWGVALTQLKNDEQALEKFEQSLKKKPTFWVYKELRKALERLKKRKLFAKYEKEGANYALYYNSWGNLLFDLDEYKTAISKFQIASKIEPDNGLYQMKWANVLREMGEYEKALSKYQTAINLRLSQSSLAWTYSYWGDALVELKRYEEAITYYKKTLEIEPTWLWSQVKWGYALIQLKKPDKALTQCQIVLKSEQVKNSVKAAAHAICGLAFIGLHQLQNAIEQCQTAQMLNPKVDWADQCLKEGKNALVNLEQPDTFAQYAPFAEKSDDILKRRFFYAWADALSKRGRYEEAITQYRKALKINPKHVWSRIFLGHALIQIDQPDEVLTLCESVLTSEQVNDKKAAAHALCGLAQVGLNQSEIAIEQCKAALEVFEKEDWAYWCLGDAYAKLNKFDEAATQYKNAVALKPKKAFYRYKWGQSLETLNRVDEAIVQYQEAVTLDKVGEIGKQAQTNIEALKEKLTLHENQATEKSKKITIEPVIPKNPITEEFDLPKEPTNTEIIVNPN